MYTYQIAKKYSVSAATLTVWAKNAGVPVRGRGVHKKDEPTARQRKIIEMAQIYSYAKVGQHFGIEKQRVQAILKRWKAWTDRAKAPFAPGDVIEWKKERFTVLDADVKSGTVMDARQRTIHCFTWSAQGKLPRKIGYNADYRKLLKSAQTNNAN